jgi:hypothetical protein
VAVGIDSLVRSVSIKGKLFSTSNQINLNNYWNPTKAPDQTEYLRGTQNRTVQNIYKEITTTARKKNSNRTSE